MKAAVLMSDSNVKDNIEKYKEVWINSKNLKPGGKMTIFNMETIDNIEYIFDLIFEHYQYINIIDLIDSENNIVRSIKRNI